MATDRFIPLDGLESESEIPKDNEEFYCPVCKGTTLLFGEHFTRKHLMEHHNWSERLANAYALYKDSPQFRAAVVQRRTEAMIKERAKLARSVRPTQKEVVDFLNERSRKDLERRATELLTRAGVFQGSLDETLSTLGIKLSKE